MRSKPLNPPGHAMERKAKSSTVRLNGSLAAFPPSHTSINAIAEILALGYLRFRKRQARELAKKPALTTEKCLDDVAHRGRVGTENRTLETGAADG